MTYSDAARDYADRLYYPHSPSTVWFAAAAAFDAALATVATTATCCDSVGEPFDHVIDSGWLCEVHTHHTCGSTNPHEPGCGLVPLVNLTELEGWPATTAPVRLTDPDDPRIQVGALYAVTFRPGHEESTTYHHRITAASDGGSSLDHVRGCVRCGAEVILLEEAPEPDPDAVIVAAITAASTIGWDDEDSRFVLADLRRAGLNIVKAGE